MSPTSASPGFSQSLERGLAILSSFSPDRPLLGISELAREVGLSRSTHTATSPRSPSSATSSRTRRPGSTGSARGCSISASRRSTRWSYAQIAAPHLQELSDETGHTVNMAILDGVDIVYVERCRSSQQGQREIDLNLHVGSRLPAYCTSMGKVLLAFLAAGRARALSLDRIEFVRRGPRHAREQDRPAAELAGWSSPGVAVNDEELAYGLRSVAVPVRTQAGDVVAAINLAAHRSFVSMEELVVRLSPALERTVLRSPSASATGSARLSGA